MRPVVVVGRAARRPRSSRCRRAGRASHPAGTRRSPGRPGPGRSVVSSVTAADEARLLQRVTAVFRVCPTTSGTVIAPVEAKIVTCEPRGHQLAGAGALAQHLALRLGGVALHLGPRRGPRSGAPPGRPGHSRPTTFGTVHLVGAARDQTASRPGWSRAGCRPRLCADHPALGHRVRELVLRRHLEAGLFQAFRRIGRAQPGDVGTATIAGPRAHAEGHRRALLGLAAAAVGRDRVLLDDLVPAAPRWAPP